MIDCPLLSTCNVISADTFFNNWEFLLEHFMGIMMIYFIIHVRLFVSEKIYQTIRINELKSFETLVDCLLYRLDLGWFILLNNII